jgi:hypothetical protein
MKRCLTWFLVPLLVGVAAGTSLTIGSAAACRPMVEFWIVEKADPQPEGAAADAPLWPSSGQLGRSSISLQDTAAWLSIDY